MLIIYYKIEFHRKFIVSFLYEILKDLLLKFKFGTFIQYGKIYWEKFRSH